MAPERGPRNKGSIRRPVHPTGPLHSFQIKNQKPGLTLGPLLPRCRWGDRGEWGCPLWLRHPDSRGGCRGHPVFDTLNAHVWATPRQQQGKLFD
jgi:hypothetical protein